MFFLYLFISVIVDDCTLVSICSREIIEKKKKKRHVLSNVIECLKQNIRKKIDCKRPSSTKQNIRTEICKN